MRRISLALIIALSMAWCEPVWASTQWTTENVYRAIVTESIGEGREGMRYVASCFWNRRTSCLGLDSVGAGRSDFTEFEAKQPLFLREYAHHLAVRVVDGVGGFDLVHGATNFESLDFARPAWVKDGEYKEVFRYRKHVFYKRKVKWTS